MIYVDECLVRLRVYVYGYDLAATISVDLAGILGGRMASAEGRSVPSGVGYGARCPLLSRLGGLGERRELPQRGPERGPAETYFGVF